MIQDSTVPPELQNLTVQEEILISKHLSQMYISRLRSDGHFSYRNHAIAILQDINTFTNELSWRVTDAGIFVVREPRIEIPHRDYMVRVNSVLKIFM